MAEVKVGAQRGPPPSATPHPYQPPDAADMKPGGGYGSGGGMGPAEEALRVAAGKGQMDRVRELLQAGTTLDTDEEGRTALHYAAHNGHPEVCRLLINHGCPLDLQDSGGYTAVQRACSQGQVEALEVCVQGGCGVNLVDQHGNTALHEAAWHGYSQSVELLIQHNANVFATNKSGFTALHLAAQNGHNESSRVLLYGALDPDLQNNYGDTALHTAARYGHAGVTRILISAKCQLNLQNKNGDTALHIAAALKRRKIAKILVESHADIHVHNKQNEAAVDVARRKDNPEIVLIINSLARTHSSGLVKGRGEVLGVTFKDDVEQVEEGPAAVPPDEEPAPKPEKERGFFAFFKKKKKDKDKESTKEKGGKQTVKKALASTSTGTHGVSPSSGVPPSIRRVSGFFSHYVPQNGTQYYRDLAGNIKQGPVGYTPVCHCRPVFQHIEQTMMDAREKLYDHIHASHQVLQDRIRQLDVETSQQTHFLEPGTRQRLEAERRACQAALDQRLQQERQRAQLLVQSYGEELHSQVQNWLEDRLSSYGHCLDHHHDDSALPPNHIFSDVHFGPNGGRLFRSRSDETLSASDNSGRGRKRQFYESRKAAMEQIRGWKVPGGRKEVSSSRRKDRRPSTDTLDRREGKEEKVDKGGGAGGGGSTGKAITVTADVHHSSDQLADLASARHAGQDREGREGGVDRRQDNANRQPFTGAGGRRSPSFNSVTPHPAQFLPHVHPGQPTPYPPLSHYRQPHSHGNLSSHHAGRWGTSMADPSHTPPDNQLQHGGLHGNARDNGVYERSRSSSRLRPVQVRERVDRTRGHEALEEKGPARAVSPSRLYNGERGAGPQPHAGYAPPHPRHSVHNPLPEGQRWHVRTRSTEGLLEGVDSAGGKRRSRSEERVLDSATGRQQLPAALEEHSGYVTDSAMRNTHLYHTDLIMGDQRLWNSNSNFPPNSSQRDTVDSGSREQVLRHPRSAGIHPSWKDQAQYCMAHVHSDRAGAGDQRTGYGQQAPSSRHPPSAQQQGWPPSSSYHPPSVQTRSVNSGGAQCNPYDRPRPKTPTDKDTPPYSKLLGKADMPSGSNIKVHNGQSSSDGHAHPQAEGADDSVAPVQHFSTFKPLSDRVVLQDTRCAQHTDNPAAHVWARGGQGKDQTTGRNSAPLSSTAHVSTSSNRTSSPRQTYTTSVSKSSVSLSQDREPSSPDPVSSGHYSVSGACLRHTGLPSYSPVEQADSKEDSTCSSNQDSGYSSRLMHGKGGCRGADSTTPSSSFSTDHSLSAGTPSTTGSPYMHLSGHSYSDYVPMGGGSRATHQGNSFSRGPEDRTLNGGLTPDWPREEARNVVSYRPPGQQAGNAGFRPGSQAGPPAAGNLQRQVQGWYQHKLLEAAQRLRNSQQYRQPTENHNIHTAAPSSAPGVRFDPVHGSDV